MNYILVAYVLGLFYLSANLDKVFNKEQLRAAWIWFVFIIFSKVGFAALTAAQIRSTRNMALIEIWKEGVAWLLLGISILCLVNALIGNQSPDDHSRQ